MSDSISVIIPAFNEEKTLEDAVHVVSKVLREVKSYEIIIVNDGSTDATGKIAQRLARKNSNIKILHHAKNEGFGATFNDGLTLASKKFVTGFPADNDMYRETFRDIVRARKGGVLVSTYMSRDSRPYMRRIATRGFTIVMNFIFGLKLKYYNGYFICPLKLVKPLTLESKGFTYFAELKIKLIKNGVKYIEISYICAPRRHGTSKALSAKSIFQALHAIISLALTKI